MNPADDALRTFVFADLSGYTALTEAHGDDDAAVTAARFFELTRSALSERSRLVKTLGDGVMIVADSIPEGIRVALLLAGAVRAEPNFPAARVGLHAGTAVETGGDYFGGCVNLTARVMAAAEPGQILCTAVVAEDDAASQLAPPRTMGFARLKHIREPVALYALFASEAAPPPMWIDPVCRMRIDPTPATFSAEHEGELVHFCSRACCDQYFAEPSAYPPARGT